MKRKSNSTSVSLKHEILVAENLQKTYGNRPALKGLSFSLRTGRILGFLGPNGAGKTTSIRILTTMMEPDAGKFSVDGIGSEYPQEIRRRIGVLPENLGFPRQMTGIEYLTYFGQLYGQSANDAKSRGLALLEEVGMSLRARSLIGSYSHGMRQRIGIARALINDPIVLFLDEPTLGLDPRGQQDLLELIKRIASERDTGVVLCSHLLSEVENICDDVVIMNLGQIVAKGTVSEVIGRVQQNVIMNSALRILVPSSSIAKTQRLLKGIPLIGKVDRIGEEGWLRMELVTPVNGKSSETNLTNNAILSKVIRAKIPIIAFEVEGNRLQDVFLRLTEDQIK